MEEEKMMEEEMTKTEVMEENAEEVREEAEKAQERSPRKVFSRIGFAYGLLMAATIAAQLLLASIGYHAGLSESIGAIWMAVLTLVPTYAVGLPICMAVLKKLPASRPEIRGWPLKRLVPCFFICVFVMYIGNIVGNLLMMAVSSAAGTKIPNPVETVVMGNAMWVNLIAMAVIAPIGEEFLYRRLLIDRVIRYGEGPAVLLSAVVFGLSHGNFFQFFYAFGLGLIFAYVYVKTGKLRYSVIFHMLINFMGSVASVYVLKHEGSLVLFYGAFLLVSVILGLVFLIASRKKIAFHPGEEDLGRGKRGKTMFLNLGMLCFFVICAILFAF